MRLILLLRRMLLRLLRLPGMGETARPEMPAGSWLGGGGDCGDLLP
jgi:hypothetical protein